MLFICFCVIVLKANYLFWFFLHSFTSVLRTNPRNVYFFVFMSHGHIAQGNKIIARGVIKSQLLGVWSLPSFAVSWFLETVSIAYVCPSDFFLTTLGALQRRRILFIAHPLSFNVDALRLSLLWVFSGVIVQWCQQMLSGFFSANYFKYIYIKSVLLIDFTGSEKSTINMSCHLFFFYLQREQLNK